MPVSYSYSSIAVHMFDLWRVASKLILFCGMLLCICCNNSKSIENTLYSSERWYDRFGNAYRFRHGQIETQLYFGVPHEFWMHYGSFSVKNNSLYVSCTDFWDGPNQLQVVSFLSDKIVLNSSLGFCYAPLSPNEEIRPFELWKNDTAIIDSSEHLVSLVIRARPGHYSGLRRFELAEDKSVKIGFQNENTVDSTFTATDSVFNSILYLLQIIPLEAYSDRYGYLERHGIDYTIDVKTNRISRNISCFGALPEGLDNLLRYILHITYDMK